MLRYVEANNILNRFIRFGKLDSFQIQNVHVVKGKEPGSIHVAPEKRGFYAMPLKYQELFLIGNIQDTQPKSVFPKNKNGNYPAMDYKNAVEYNAHKAEVEAWLAAEKEYDKKIDYIKHNLIRHSFTLKDSDLIWNHLHFYNAVPNKEICRRSGDWVLTTVASYKKAIGKSIAKMAKDYEMHRGNINVSKLDRDCFEVFIPVGTIK